MKNLFKYFCSLARSYSLKNRDFCIVSDNCWGAFTYQYFGLPYNTPFVGLFVFSPDYLRLLNDLDFYLSNELSFIEAKQSKYKNELIENETFDKYPIALLHDVEIHFLHYSSNDEAKMKWERRLKRFNMDNIVIKFCDRDLATPELIESFFQLEFKRKIFLSSKKYQNKCAIKLKNENGEFIVNEWPNYLRSVSPIRLFNDLF